MVAGSSQHNILTKTTNTQIGSLPLCEIRCMSTLSDAGFYVSHYLDPTFVVFWNDE